MTDNCRFFYFMCTNRKIYNLYYVQVDLTAKLCLSFCLELQSAKSTYQHVDLDL